MNNIRLSKLTIGLGIYIVASASFMLQARDWLFRAFGEPIIINAFKVVFLSIVLVVLFYAFIKNLGIIRISLILGLFILGYLFCMWQPYFTEKTHVVTYGLLGYLTARDLLIGEKPPCFKNLIMLLSFICLISAADELFQMFLPYRVGEIRDFVTNIISGILGINLLLVIKREIKII